MVLLSRQVKGVPVLLSMLVLLFKHRTEGSTAPLPASRYELYVMATRLAVARTDGKDLFNVLRLIARDNQLNLSDDGKSAGARREFTSIMAMKALKGDAEGELLWQELLNTDDGVPLVKVLEDAGGTNAGLYQFRHLSFQEGLCAWSIITGATSLETVLGDKIETSKFLAFMTSNTNVCRIGGGELGNLFFNALCTSAPGCMTLAGNQLEQSQVISIAGLLRGGKVLTTVRRVPSNRDGGSLRSVFCCGSPLLHPLTHSATDDACLFHAAGPFGVRTRRAKSPKLYGRASLQPEDQELAHVHQSAQERSHG